MVVAGLIFVNQPLSATEPVTVAARPDLPPYVTSQASGGIEIDLVKAIFEQAGHTPKFIQVTSRRMNSQFEAGLIDGLLTQLQTTVPHGCATDIYFEHPNVGITLESKDVPLTQLEDLAELSVLTFQLAKHYLGDKFSEVVTQNSRYVEHPFQSEHIELLYQERFDVVVGDEWIIRLGQKDHFERTGEIHPVKIHHIIEPLRYTMHFQKQSMCDTINKAITIVRENGTYDAILQKHRETIITMNRK